MTEKPLFFAPRVSAPDYQNFLRQTLSRTPSGGESFAQAMAAQERPDRQKSATENAAAPSTAGNAARPALNQHETILAALRSRLSPSSLSDTAQETQASSGQERAVPAGSPSGTPSTEKASAPAQERPQGLPLRPVRSGKALSVAGGIALDGRTLFTLQRVEQRQAERSVGTGGMSGNVNKTTSEQEQLGQLSARYESGNRGIAAIGYDRNGGTSYGKYQISSRRGSFDQFLNFLSHEAPDLEKRLRSAGKANTGGTKGAVPTEWKAIAEEAPARFERLQEDFIRQSHYRPALEGVQTSLGLKELSDPLRQVLWSTAVQHGPNGARRIFEQAARQLEARGQDPLDERELINRVYAVRRGQFSSSTPSVRAAVQRRFDDEQRQALAMLDSTTALA